MNADFGIGGARQFRLHPGPRHGHIYGNTFRQVTPGTARHLRRLKASVEPCGVRDWWKFISRRLKNIGDDPQVLPIVPSTMVPLAYAASMLRMSPAPRFAGGCNPPLARKPSRRAHG